MVIEVTILIAIVGCFVGVAGWVKSRDSKVADDSEWKGMVNAKLDMLLGLREDVSEIEGKLNASLEKLDKRQDELSERLVKVEQSVKSAHYRLDGRTEGG